MGSSTLQFICGQTLAGWLGSLVLARPSVVDCLVQVLRGELVNQFSPYIGFACVTRGLAFSVAHKLQGSALAIPDSAKSPQFIAPLTVDSFVVRLLTP